MSETTMLPLELTLVLAATRDMGIGLRGALPWTGLKKEMAYFARITKRLPPSVEPPAMNAVIMGRKTWDSIPPKFRPLSGRLNIVISRAFPSPPAAPAGPPGGPEARVRAASLEQALGYLQALRAQGSRAGASAGAAAAAAPALGRVFVVGGAQVYAAALARPEARRVLLTQVAAEFACDTHVALRLGGEGRGAGGEADAGWARRSKAELDAWAGEVVPEGLQVENGTAYEFQMWERTD